MGRDREESTVKNCTIVCPNVSCSDHALNFSSERRGEIPDVGHMRDRGDYELIRIARKAHGR